MKKTLAIFLSAIMVLCAFPLSAFAENGPVSDHAFLNVVAPDENGSFIGQYGQPVGTPYVFYSNKTATSNAYSGMTYDVSTNTLAINTITNPVGGALSLTAYEMGDDFTICVNGKASLSNITVYGGNLTITGSGELAVNTQKKSDSAIRMYGEGAPAKLTVGKDVVMRLYAGGGYVVDTYASTNSVAADAYSFGNGSTFETKSSNYQYEETEGICGVYNAEPDEDRWGGMIADSKSDKNPNHVYVVGEDTDEETNEKLITLGKYVYVPQFNAYARDYSFGDRYSNGYEYAYTEAQWAAQSEYTVRETEETTPVFVEYRDADDLNSEYYYTRPRVTRTSDPEGVYGYGAFTRTSGDVVTKGYFIYRYVLAPNTDKYIEDSSFTPIEITEDELGNSEWTPVVEKGREYLQWTGTLVSGDFDVYKDGSGNKYVTDYEDNVYSITADSVVLGDKNYYVLEKASNVSVSSLTLSRNIITDNNKFNYALVGKELLYNTNNEAHTQHTWDGETVTKAPTCTEKGEKIQHCLYCSETKTQEIAALGHSWNAGVVTKKATPSATGIKVQTCSRCKAKRNVVIPKIPKYNNTLTVANATKKLKVKNVKKKKQTFTVLKPQKAKGRVTYKKSSGNAKITVASNGTITVKKGLKKGKYKIKVKVTAAGDANYKALTKTANVTIIIS